MPSVEMVLQRIEDFPDSRFVPLEVAARDMGWSVEKLVDAMDSKGVHMVPGRVAMRVCVHHLDHIMQGGLSHEER